MAQDAFAQAATDATGHGHDRYCGHDGHGGANLNRLSVSATVHCMTGCVIGEVIGLAAATALGWSTAGQIALAVGLAYLFGFALTSIPWPRPASRSAQSFRSPWPPTRSPSRSWSSSPTPPCYSFPGGVSDEVFDARMWLTMALGVAIAFPFAFAFAANKWLIGRGKGHALVHQYQH